MFKLDSRLEKDTIKLVSWPLCDVQLMNDAQFPWLILVPRVDGASELYHLDKRQREQLDAESIFLSKTLMQVYQGDKLNTAALGNVVNQLHIHHVVRFKADIAWPAPIWGKFTTSPYSNEALIEQKAKLALVIDRCW